MASGLKEASPLQQEDITSNTFSDTRVQAFDRSVTATVWMENIDVRNAVDAVLRHGPFAAHETFAREFIDTFDSLAAQGVADAVLFESLRHLVARRFSPEDLITLEGEERRVAERVDQIDTLLQSTPGMLVDIGCASGDITAALGRKWNLEDSRAIGLDVVDGQKAIGFTFKLVSSGDTTLPVETNSADVITLLAVLHHMTDPMSVIREASRILKPGGSLVVREFDASNLSVQRTNEIIDHLYYRVFDSQHETAQYLSFRPSSTWLSMAEAGGFRCVGLVSADESHPLKPVHYHFKNRES